MKVKDQLDYNIGNGVAIWLQAKELNAVIG